MDLKVGLYLIMNVDLDQHSTCILHKADVPRHVMPYITLIHQITYLHDTAGNIEMVPLSKKQFRTS